jgi:DNA primase
VANLLDRAIWLLLHRSDMWSSLDGESQDELAAKDAPYDMFFSCIDRSLSEHGPVAPSALMEALRGVAREHPQGSSVIERIAQFHDPEPNADLTQELGLVLDRLRLKDVEEELELLFQSGAVSPDSQHRSSQLMATRARLKAQLAQAPLVNPR